MVVHSTRGKRGFFLDPQVTPPSRFTPKGDQGSSRGIARPFFASRTLLSSSISLYSYFSHRKVNFHIFHSHVKIIRGEVACMIVLLEISFGETSRKTRRLVRPRGWVSKRFLPTSMESAKDIGESNGRRVLRKAKGQNRLYRRCYF